MSKITLPPLPIIETERLVLRDITFQDAPDLYEYAKEPYVGPNAGWAPHSSLHETNTIIQMFLESKKNGQPGVFALHLKPSNKMIGTIELYNVSTNFKAELGYALSHYHWGKGFMVEAAKAVIKWGFEFLHLKRIEVKLFPQNHQSKRLVEKLGFTFEGVARKSYLRYDGCFFDCLTYGMTDDDYFDNKNKR